MTDAYAKQHNYYCTRQQQAIITRRAKAAGMSRSAFMVACALHDEPAGEELIPTPDERKVLLDHLSATAEVVTRLMAPVPDLGMPVLDALEVLCRVKTSETEP